MKVRMSPVKFALRQIQLKAAVAGEREKVKQIGTIIRNPEMLEMLAEGIMEVWQSEGGGGFGTWQDLIKQLIEWIMENPEVIMMLIEFIISLFLQYNIAFTQMSDKEAETICSLASAA